MTTLEFLKTALRLWYVVLLGVAATGALYVAMTSHPPVYTAKVTMVLLAPPSSTNRNALQQPSPVAVASVAVMEVNDRPNRVTASSPDVTLAGKGVVSGTSIELRHQGSQWAPSAPQPYIDIEAVDTSPEVVARRVRDAVGAVRSAITEQEDSFQVARSERVVVTQSPAEPTVTSLPSSPTRALGGSLLIGMGVTSWAIVRVNRLRQRRAAGRSPAGAGEPVPTPPLRA